MTRNDVVQALRAHLQNLLAQKMPNSDGVNKRFIEEAFLTRKAKVEAMLAKQITTTPCSSIGNESIVFLHVEWIYGDSRKLTADQVVFFFPELDRVVFSFECLGQTVFVRDLYDDYRGKLVGDQIVDSGCFSDGRQPDTITVVRAII